MNLNPLHPIHPFRFGQQHGWGALLGVTHTPFSAGCFESIVERDGAPRCMAAEWQGEEDLLWYSLMHKLSYVLKPEFAVVLRMTN